MTAFAQLKTIEDPRDNLDKARRYELRAFAKENGIDLDEQMPAILMRRELRKRGLVSIRIPSRPLGVQSGGNAVAANMPAPNVKEINAEDDLERQYKAELARRQAEQQKAPERKPEPPKSGFSEIAELRKRCKGWGIPLARTDNIETLRRKLAKHGQDTP